MTYASENRAWLEPYIADIAERMGLSHWKVELIDDDPEYGYMAQCWIQGEHRWARMLIGEDHHNTPEDIRDSVVHELLHLHLHDLENTIRQVESHLAPAAYDVVSRFHHIALEQGICAITRAWSGALPLPRNNPAT